MQQMDRLSEILTEIQEIAPFLGKSDPVRNPYSLPVGFFDSFPQLLMHRIQMEATGAGEFVKKITEISPADEIHEISPLLAGLQRKTTYKVPEGYFESLNTMISASGLVYENGLAAEESATVIQISSGKIADKYAESNTPQKIKIFNFSRILKYSVAACLIGLLGLTLFNMNRKSITDPVNGLTTVSDQDMANYLDTHDVHWTPGITSPSETASVDFSDNDIHELFSNVSDDELEQYNPSLPLNKGSVN
jgi:hypothetical protein